MNKLMKKTVTVALAGAFMFSMASTGFAQTTAPAAGLADMPTAVVEPARTLGVVQMYGKIVDINKDGQTLSIEVQPNEGESMIFHIDESTYVLDAENALPMDLEKRTNDMVSVYYGPAVTMSIPAQSHAVAIFGNAKAELDFPRYAAVEAVEKLDNGDIRVTTDGGSRIVTLGKDMPISPYLTKNIVTLNDVQKGSQMVLWYDVMTLSMPAQATAQKAVLLHTPEADTAEAADIIIDGTQITAAGSVIDGAAYTTKIGEETVTMVPARAVAQKLGYDVLWNEGTVTLNLHGYAKSATYTVGSTDYGLNRMLVKLNAAPENKDGVTYVPLNFFSEVLKVTVNSK